MLKRISLLLLKALAILAPAYLLQMLIDNRTINPYYAHVMILMSIFVVLSVSLNLVVGITGQFSLGHAGFMAIGAYTAAILTKNPGLIIPEFITGYPLFVLATLVGGFLAAVAGLLVGLPTLRLRGDYLAIATLGFGEIVRILLLNWPFAGGASGYFGIQRFTSFFWAFLFAAVTVVLIRNFINSSHGRACISIREDEIAAETMGIPTTRYKIIAFVIGAFFAGIAGSLMAHLNRMVIPASFSFMLSVEVLLMVVLGGLGSISGSIGASVFLTFASEALRQFRELRIIVYALLLIAIMLFRPKGLLGNQELSLSLLKKASLTAVGRLRRRQKDAASTTPAD
ncbi:MAG: branched-chain amino acid ABC transporter permease [Firmicutes bacterium]|nr:branched-chain amino acid ABC transporter permease [Bacillota bacterium]